MQRGRRGPFRKRGTVRRKQLVSLVRVPRESVTEMKRAFDLFCEQALEQGIVQRPDSSDESESFTVCQHESIAGAKPSRMILERDSCRYIKKMRGQSRSLAQLVRCLGWSAKKCGRKPVCAAATKYDNILYVSCNQPALRFDDRGDAVQRLLDADESHEEAYRLAEEVLEGECSGFELGSVSGGRFKSAWVRVGTILKKPNTRKRTLKNAPLLPPKSPEGVDVIFARIMSISKSMKEFRDAAETAKSDSAKAHCEYFEKCSPLLVALMCLAGTFQRVAEGERTKVRQALALPEVEKAVNLFIVVTVGRVVAASWPSNSKPNLAIFLADLEILYKVATSACDAALEALLGASPSGPAEYPPSGLMLTPKHLLDLAKFKKVVFVTWKQDEDKDLHCEKLLHLFMKGKLEELGEPEEMSTLNFYISKPPCGSCSIYFCHFLRQGAQAASEDSTLDGEAAPTVAASGEGGEAVSDASPQDVPFPHVFGCSGSWYGEGTAYCSVSEGVNDAFWGRLCLNSGAEPQASADS